MRLLCHLEIADNFKKGGVETTSAPYKSVPKKKHSTFLAHLYFFYMNLKVLGSIPCAEQPKKRNCFQTSDRNKHHKGPSPIVYKTVTRSAGIVPKQSAQKPSLNKRDKNVL